MGDTDVYDYTDGIFLGRYNTQAQGGIGAYDDGGTFDYNSDGITLSHLGTNLPIPTADLAYRVDVNLYNALYVQDIRKKYVTPRTTDISKNLLIHAQNIARNQNDNNFTSTKIVDDAGITHTALDVFHGKRSDSDDFQYNYLSTIYNKYFADQSSGNIVYNIDLSVPEQGITYLYDGSGSDTYQYSSLGFGSSTYGYDYSGIFTSSRATHSGKTYNKLMTLDYSANQLLNSLYAQFVTYSTTQYLSDFSNNSTPPINSNRPTGQIYYNLTNNNSIDLRSKHTKSISFYGTVTQPCRISVVYIYSAQYTNSGQETFYTYFVEQTQYDTSIKKSGTVKFGFNVDNINAQYITLIFRNINDNQPVSDTSAFTIYASYNYILTQPDTSSSTD